jgi:hypothetical protein
MKPKPKCGLRGLIQKGGNGVRFDLGKTPSVAWCRQEDGGNDRGLLLGRDGELGRSMLGCVVGKEKKWKRVNLGFAREREELARLGWLQRVLKIRPKANLEYRKPALNFKILFMLQT